MRARRSFASTMVLVVFTLGAAALVMGSGECFPEPEEPIEVCVEAGCSGQLCVAESMTPVYTTCEWRPEYACLELSSCGPNGPGGACAWERSAAYEECVAEARCAVPGYERVAQAAVEADPAAWHGRAVLICGALELGPVACTRIGCPLENPCCNACHASLRLSERIAVSRPTDDAEWGCSGDECGLACYPFPQAEVGEPRCYWGVFSVTDPYGEYGVLKLDGWRADCGL